MIRPSEHRAFGLAAVALVLAPSDRGHRRQAVIGFMIGLSTTVILLGAERDAEVEHQTARDTIRLREALGEHGAQVADTGGRASD